MITKACQFLGVCLTMPISHMQLMMESKFCFEAMMCGYHIYKVIGASLSESHTDEM